MMTSFGETVRALRLERNLTQEQLSGALNISPQAVSKWERGQALPDLPLIPARARALNVTADALFGMDASALEATVTRYNELCEKGEDEDFGKPAEYMIPVEGETYYAFYMTPGSSVTFGGLQIDTDAHVLDTNDQPISGLYAAGEVAFTGLFDAEYPCCGMAIGSAVYYGRVAAANAVAGK